MSACGSPYATATLFSTRTTVIPTVVVATSSDSSGGVDLNTFTSSYTTTVQIPTSTLYATPTCAPTTSAAAASTPTAVRGGSVASTSAVIPTGVTSSTKTQTLTSALATVSNAGGSQSVVYVTYTQTMASPEPVYVTTVIPAAQTSSAGSAGSTSSTSTHKGAVIGGIVGGVVALAALFFVILVCLQRRRRSRGQVSLDELFRRSAGGMRGRADDDDEEVAASPTIAGVSRNNSGLSTAKAAGSADLDPEDEMTEGQIGTGIVPTLGRTAAMPPAWPLSISTTAANGGTMNSVLARSGSDSSKAVAAPYTPGSGNGSDPSTPYEDATAGPAEGAMAFVGGRPASYAGQVKSTPSSPTTATAGGAALPWTGSSPRQQSQQRRPSLTRPRSVGNIDAHVVPSSRPTSPGYHPHSPPLRPTSPPFVAAHQRPSLGAAGPQRSMSPPPMRANSPPMWRSPLPTASPAGQPQRSPSGGGNFAMHPEQNPRLNKGHRTLSWGSGSMAQLQAMTAANGAAASPPPQQQQQQQRPRRQQTASPPPPGAHSGDWPPSRYGHLDVALGAPSSTPSSNSSSAATTPSLNGPQRQPSGSLAPPLHLAPTSPLSSTVTDPTLTGSETFRSVDSSRYWKSPTTTADAATPPALPAPTLSRPVAKRGGSYRTEKDDDDESAALAAEKALWGRTLFVTNGERVEAEEE